ncbi:MAG: PAS domain-containing protein [Acidobacteria bacterium]|nr:PAS domain-containing protein [Acidobacteriota bacterium]
MRALLGDIQRRTESALRGDERLRALAQTVFEELPEGLIVVDSRLRILDANPAARAMFDSGTLSPGTPLLDLVRSTGILAAFESALADGRPVSTTVTVFGEARGDRFLELSVRSLPGEHLPEVPAAVALIRDATQREKTEAMRKQFVADVSHELRTPVAAIRAASETLGQETEGLTADGQHFLSIILRQARHMEELVSDLMDLSQIEIGAVTLTIERHRAKELLEDVAHDLSAASEARQVKVVVEAPEDATVDGDRRRLEQILRNLLDNAIKFSPVGGTVTASAERCGAATRIRVADEGRGIPKGETDKIFQRFYRVDPSRAKTVPGTGLGLAIVKHLLILHAGSIAVSSEVGAGSVFTVKLPDKLKAE